MRLSVTETGKKLDGIIVAFHGVTDNGASLADLATRFGARWQVVLVDSLGHGFSERFSDDDLRDPFHAACEAASGVVKRYAQQAATGKVFVIGHSMGGAIAAWVAVNYPDLVAGAVLEDPAILTASQAKSYREAAPDLAAGVRGVCADPGQALTDIRAAHPAWSASECAGWVQGKTHVDMRLVESGVVGTTDESLFANLAVPTLLIAGDRDNILFDDGRLATIINPVITIERIAGASHCVRRDQPEKFYDAVDRWMSNQ
ncbi:Pimeloyl-ACP methyl ester carboxylesterase [Arcanobacterium phocae]|uniref:Pimeloyl-ACP methyl ester carboxylesterase n=1 Tax=Arcanobacterium phocae TaxID=131112 RepID=A0A1H2LC65_9ACTO|nr:alpha/beta hydrolase [Arcanobacterium phocae]SDU78593.1 Pimeloyl-ACP methyl ester carboxylesterase [Arcanobacterium phocae]